MIVVDEADVEEQSIHFAPGRDLAGYTRRYSKRLQRNLEERRSTKDRIKIQISGSMTAQLAGGKYSDYKSHTTIRVYDMDLVFNNEYLEVINLLTGQDLKKVAYEINMMRDCKGGFRLWRIAILRIV